MKRLYKSLLVSAAILAPMTGLAAIDTTHHDMTAYLAGVTEKCAYCHAISLADMGADAGLGQVGSFCARVCHDASRPNLGAAIVTGVGTINPDDFTTTAGLNGLPRLAGSHGLTKADIALYGGLDAPAAVTTTNWPHAAEASMQCTTCHAVHDGTNPPFLNGPLATGDNTTAFCNRCHTGVSAAGTAGRWENIATMGAHPTEFVYSGAGTTGPGANAAKGGRSISFKAPLVQVVAAATDTVANFNAVIAGNAWRMGGHIVDTAKNLPVPLAQANATTRVGCYSCHSAHQDADGGTTLTLGATKATRATNTGDSSILCVACHGATPAPITNPIWNVGDTNYGHPANETAARPYQHDHEDNPGAGLYGHGAVHPNIPSTGSFPIDVVNDLTTIAGITANTLGTLDGANAGGEVLCETCHDVHGGVTGQMAIRNIGAMAATDSICEKCHGGNPQETGGAGINRHHPTVAAANIDNGYNLAVGALPWRDANNNETMNDGLGCADCHVFNGTAHNW